MTTHIDIIICTYNRADILAECLDAMLAQDPPLTSYENCKVFVVDNNSPDHTSDIIHKYADKSPCFHYLLETVQGSGQARNCGLMASSADWILCVDDDCLVYPDWMTECLRTIAREDFDCFGGVYMPWHRNTEKPCWMPENFGACLTEYKEYGSLPEKVYPVGGNLAFKRELAIKSGSFPNNLGIHGDVLGYGEETALIKNMAKNGGRIGFNPKIKVAHYVVPAKYKMQWHFRSSYAMGRDDSSILEKKTSKLTGIRLLISLPFILVRDIVRGTKKLGRENKLNWKNLKYYSGIRLYKRMGRIRGNLFKA